jgi:hypothetical protein
MNSIRSHIHKLLNRLGEKFMRASEYVGNILLEHLRCDLLIGHAVLLVPQIAAEENILAASAVIRKVCIGAIATVLRVYTLVQVSTVQAGIAELQVFSTKNIENIARMIYREAIVGVL